MGARQRRVGLSGADPTGRFTWDAQAKRLARKDPPGSQRARPNLDFGRVSALLEVRDLSVRFGGVIALDRVSFAVEAGQVVALIGPNGAGKTTLFNVITRVYRPAGGTVLIDGDSVLAVRPHQVLPRGPG